MHWGPSSATSLPGAICRTPQFASRATTGEGRQKFLALKDLVPQVRRSVHARLPADDGEGLSGIAAESKRPEPRRGHRHHAAHAGHRRSLNVGDIRQVEPNIHAGVKYSRQLMDEYLGNEPLDDLNKGFFTLASYNAGPTRIRQLRREAERRGLDPNVWFGHVERIAVRTHRPRDRLVREQHLQVLHRLSAGRRGRTAAGRPAREIEGARRATATTAFLIFVEADAPGVRTETAKAPESRSRSARSP